MVRESPLKYVKCVGPKLVPFFKTLMLYFALFANSSELGSIFYCIVKCLPVACLIVFVLLHGMNFTDAYSYSRNILLGLIFSMLGDAFLVWKHAGFFIHGVGSFAIAQMFYAWAFGFRPFNRYAGAVFTVIASLVYAYLLPGLEGVMVYVVLIYLVLIGSMAWRAVARVQLLDDLWTWTKLCGCAGAIFFLTSDLVIAVDKFRGPLPYSHPIIMTTYYAAQLGITLSVVDSQVDAIIEMSVKSQ